MLQISFIKTNKECIISDLKKRGFHQPEKAIENILNTDQQCKQVQFECDKMLAQANIKAKRIGELIRLERNQEIKKIKESVNILKEKIKKFKSELNKLREKLTERLYQIPNILHKNVPDGTRAEDNKVVLERGEKPILSKEALPHWDLVKKYNLVDFELGNKVTGAGFPFYIGKAARLQRALVNFFLDQATAEDYTEIQPPILVNETSAYATGQLPDKEGQMYKLINEDLYLIPTAEVPITNIFRDKIIEEKKLPIKMMGFTPCFRREAGSWGSHVRGLNRLHQFDKVELVQITHPNYSYLALEKICEYIQSLLDKLMLPYRKICLCSGDIGFNAALCYDMEVYSSAQKQWLEVSSASNFETYQANRMRLRYRDSHNKKFLTHTLNASALALPRIIAAILENNQTENGIKIPEVLHNYCHFDRID